MKLEKERKVAEGGDVTAFSFPKRDYGPFRKRGGRRTWRQTGLRRRVRLKILDFRPPVREKNPVRFGGSKFNVELRPFRFRGKSRLIEKR